MSKRLTGLNPLAYIGVEPVQPVNTFMRNRSPGSTDSHNVNIGDFWVNTSAQQLWVLVSLAGGVATWITLFGGAADHFITDAGTATPIAGNLNVNGDGINISTVGSGNTVNIDMSSTPTFTGITLNGFTGGILDVNGSGVVSEIHTTNHSLLIGNAAGTISSLGVATNGQLPIGSTGADPVLSTLTAGTGVTIANSPGAITISASGSVPITFDADSGTATPSGGVITMHGTGDITTTATASTVTFVGSGLTTAATGSGNATTSGNTITFTGGTGITTSGTGSTVTITASGNVPITFDANAGSATPSAGVINILGTGGLETTASGNTVTIAGPGVPQMSTVTLTSSQVKNLSTTTIQIVPAQGANTIINPISVVAFLNYGGNNPFTTVTNPIIWAFFTNTYSISTVVTQVSGSNAYTQSQSNYEIAPSSGNNGGTPVASCVNQPMYIGLSTGSTDIGGNAAGDNTLTIQLVYEVITVPL